MSKQEPWNIRIESEVKDKTLGDRLRDKREELGFGIQEIARKLKISARMIKALEEDNYAPFPAKVYARGILVKLAARLSFPLSPEAEAHFEEAWLSSKERGSGSSLLRPGRRGVLLFTPRLVGLILIFAVFLLFIGFSSLRVARFLALPELAVEEPGQESVWQGPVLKVSGRAERESRLTINDREIRIDTEGNFSDQIELAAGAHTLEFLVEDRFGKERRKVRYVVVE